jgi:hypothetical protein
VADFGLVANGDVKNLNVSFRNNGNSPINVTFDDTPFAPFTLEIDDDAGVTFTVDANSTKTLQATYTADQAVPMPTQVIGFHTTGVTCGGGDPPSSIRLQGHSTFSGNPGITPGVLTFDVGGTGYVPCGKVATAQTVTVAYPAGSGPPPLDIIDAFVTGPFTVSPSASEMDAASAIQILPGNSQVFTITPLTVNAPQPTSADGVSGTLQINLSNDTGLTVQLSQTAQGAVLAFAPTAIDFGAAPLDAPTMQLLGITNSGNAAVGLTLAVTGSPYFTVSPSTQFSINTPSGSSTVTFLPIAAGAANGTVSLAAAGPVCGLPSPATVTLSGNGTASDVPDGDVLLPDGAILEPDGAIIDQDGGFLNFDATAP